MVVADVVPAGRTVIATIPPTPADMAAIARAPTVKAIGRKRFLVAGGITPVPPCRAT